jgi:hypothetical protein
VITSDTAAFTTQRGALAKGSHRCRLSVPGLIITLTTACAAAADNFFPFDGLLTQPLGVTVSSHRFKMAASTAASLMSTALLPVSKVRRPSAARSRKCCRA